MANEVVKYNNQFNLVVFSNFTDGELSLIMAICSKLRNKNTESITLSFDQIKELTNEKQHYTAKGYAEMIDNMYRKLINLSYFYDDGHDVAGGFHLFQSYERSISDQSVEISITPQFVKLFNSLEQEFTRFKLEEFVNLRGKYPKLLYRQLKQWRTVGYYSVTMKEFRELMDVPEAYQMRDITKRVVIPAVNKLLELKEFHFLQYKYSCKGKKVVRIQFKWHPESIPSKEDEPKTSINDELTKVLREKQSFMRNAGAYTEEPGDSIPGLPGYRYAKEEEPEPAEEVEELDIHDMDNLPF